MAWQKVRLKIPENLSQSLRSEIGQEFIKQMVDNAQDGFGVKKSGDSIKQKKFPKYTPGYAKFKGQTNVDLTLSGDMLEALKILSTKRDSVLIGFDNGSLMNARAEGNVTGSYGTTPNARRARDFLGLTKSEQLRLIKRVKDRG